MEWSDVDQATLLVLRRNLLHGLDQLVPHAAAGTLDVVPAGGSTPPAASGWLMMILLEQVNAELRERDTPAVVVPAPYPGPMTSRREDQMQPT